MITTNIHQLSTQHVAGVRIDTNVETDPIFRHSPAYTITEQDIINWDAASGGIDMSAYVTHTFLSEQAYLTSESDPIFSASPAAGITNEDIENWNAGGAVDLSSYVTYDYLSAQAYLTSVTFPDYSNTYQAKGDYITPEVLAQQSYLTTETEPAFNGSPASSITDTDIANWNAAAGTIDMSAYVTKSELVTQSYITINDVVFPDYSNTYQAKGNYLTNETDPIFSASPAAGITNEDIENWNAGGGSVDLSSYVTYDYLSAQAYITSVTFPDYSNTYQAKGNYLTSESDPIFTNSPASGITDTDIANWNAAAGTIDMSAYVTKSELVNQSYITINDVVFPDYSNTYQAKGNYLTSESDPIFSASPAAGITTQDIQNWNTGGSVDLSSYVTYDYLSAQAYLTSVTFPDYSNTYQAKGNYLTNETDPVFSASPAAGITAQDIQRWDNGGGSVDLSSYVTYDYLSAQAYLTSVTFPDYSNTYQAKGDYVTPSQLAAQGYITSVTFPDYSNTYQAKGNYLTNETDPIFSASPAAGITAQDIQNWNAGGSVDLSSYVTYEYLSAQAYLTTETDPVFSASPAAGITTQDIQNWNAGAGADLSAYVKKSELVAQSYVTQNTIVFPDYSNTYQAKGNYLTTETDPVFSASPAHTITSSDITRWNNNRSTVFEIVTKSQYVDRQDNIMYIISDADPISGVDLTAYVKKSELVAQSYITPAKLVAQSYITSAEVFANYTSYAYFYSYINDKLGTIETVLSQI